MFDLIDIIHIVGASGAGTTTLGQALEREFGYKWLDTDDYFWEDTDPPFVKPLPHEERIKRMSIAIEENPKCVISGSLCGWGDVFIPRFGLVVYADTPTDVRTRRLERREAERFGERILKGGDMYDNHIDFIEWAKGYDTSNEGRCRKTHEEWFKLLKCPLLRVDGTKPVNELVRQIAESGKIIESILPCFEINRPLLITQVYENAWDIDDAYVLKSNDNQDWLDKSIKLNRLLLSEGVSVTQYINTADNEPFVVVEDEFWSLMKKIKEVVFDPYIGDPEENGIILGRAVAELHMALDNIEDKIEACDSDFYSEFTSWIVPELEKHSVSFKDGVMDSMYAFFKRDYKTLPRQLIHRDIHTSNLLFDDGVFSYLDFDLSQRNVRVFDLVYLGCSQLVDNYKDEVRLTQWRKIFTGIIQGYGELLPLSEDEIKSLPALFLFVEILFTAFYLKSGQPDIAKSCVEMVNWLYDYGGSNMTLNTKRLTLRPLTVDDFEAVNSWAGNPENVRYMAWGPNTEEQTLEFLSSSATEGKDFAVVLKETGRVIGSCGIYPDGDNDTGEMGWILHKDCWKCGYGTELCGELIRYGFEDLKLRRIAAYCADVNYGSRRVMERNGMRREATHIKAFWARVDKEWIDRAEYAILAEEYEGTVAVK